VITRIFSLRFAETAARVSGDRTFVPGLGVGSQLGKPAVARPVLSRLHQCTTDAAASSKWLDVPAFDVRYRHGFATIRKRTHRELDESERRGFVVGQEHGGDRRHRSAFQERPGFGSEFVGGSRTPEASAQRRPRYGIVGTNGTYDHRTIFRSG
jgi:hypothetical protein